MLPSPSNQPPILHRYDQPNTRQVLYLEEVGKHQVEIAATGVELTIIGAFSTKDTDSLQVELTVIHQARNTQSHTYLRGVAADTSQLYLSGTIIVHPEAVGTNAFLDERILLVSPTAKAEAIPNLEIEQNEVKCSHAAAISSIPPEQLFYLMSRGLSQPKAIDVITEGFLRVNPEWIA